VQVFVGPTAIIKIDLNIRTPLENLRLTRSQDHVLILFFSAESGQYGAKLYDALLKNGFPAP
jgi:hypothetical protein